MECSLGFHCNQEPHIQFCLIRQVSTISYPYVSALYVEHNPCVARADGQKSSFSYTGTTGSLNPLGLCLGRICPAPTKLSFFAFLLTLRSGLPSVNALLTDHRPKPILLTDTSSVPLSFISLVPDRHPSQP